MGIAHRPNVCRIHRDNSEQRTQQLCACYLHFYLKLVSEIERQFLSRTLPNREKILGRDKVKYSQCLKQQMERGIHQISWDFTP